MAEKATNTKYYGTGRRKTSVAKVWIRPGDGRIEVNGKDVKEVFPRLLHRNLITAPLRITDMMNKVDVEAKTLGGGVTGWADSIRLGIARALVSMDENLRPTLAKYSLLTRDPREKERKKYGQPRARKRFQFSKR